MIITLLSDFGLQDYSPGIAKGILLDKLPEAKFVDLSHNIAPHQLLQCSYFLKSVFRSFPEKTIHLSLFDLFTRQPSQPLLAAVDGQFTISSDNGLLPMTFGKDLKEVYQIAQPCSDYIAWIKSVAKFIQQWDKNGFSLSGLETTKAFDQPYPFEPYVTENSISCQVIHIDRFGNVILNLSESFFEQKRNGRKFRITFSRNNEIKELSNHYSDVPEGEKLCLFNIGGFMEIAVNKGSAAQLFGFSLMSEGQLIYQKIRIEFF